MTTQYLITVNQAKVLRALNQASELSTTEIAVYARLLPNEVGEAVRELSRMGLVTHWVPVTGRTGEHLVALTGDGPAVARALSQFQGTPPVGAVVPFASGSLFSGWMTPSPIAGSGVPQVVVGADKASKSGD